jgi:hypothetical protein
MSSIRSRPCCISTAQTAILAHVARVAHFAHCSQTCRNENNKIRTENDDIKTTAHKELLACQQKAAGAHWASLTAETQQAMYEYVDQQKNFGKLDQKFCQKMSQTYGPLSFEKPVSLDCDYEIRSGARSCGDADTYDPKCEQGEKEIPLEPLEQIDGERVPNIVIIGKTGAGKSYFCNGLMGYEHPDEGVFGTGDTDVSCTRKPAGLHGKFYNNMLAGYGIEEMPINLYDTPGFADSNKCQIEANKKRIVEKFDKPIDVFGYLLDPVNPRIDANLQLIFENLNEWTMGNIWSNLVIIYGRADFSIEKREDRFYDRESYYKELDEKIQSIRERLWEMAQDGNWKKTFIDSKTDQVTSRLLVREDFDNIQYSALNVNQNRKCDFGPDGKIVTDGNKSKNCWKMVRAKRIVRGIALSALVWF